MKISKYIFTLFLGVAMLTAQVGTVLAAPASQEDSVTGKVTALECGTDSEGNTIILVTFEDAEGVSQTAGVDLETANSYGLVTLDEGGMPDCDPSAFTAILDSAPEEGLTVEIPVGDILPVEEEGMKHPVGYALSLFFDDVSDYDAIMEAHDNGTGFGVIAQALWLTNKMEGDSETFLAIVEAKQTGNFEAFALEDGSTPQNWGQFKKAILEGDKKGNLGVVMSGKGQEEDKTNNGIGSDKDKPNNGQGQEKEKNNNGKGHDKDKNKNKD